MPEEPKSANDLSRLSGIGFEFAAAVGGFIFVGYLWDRYFGTSPWGTLTGAILGLVGGMYNLIRQSMLATRESGRGIEKIEKTNGDGER